jgi:hypothetical protein
MVRQNHTTKGGFAKPLQGFSLLVMIAWLPHHSPIDPRGSIAVHFAFISLYSPKTFYKRGPNCDFKAWRTTKQRLYQQRLDGKMPPERFSNLSNIISFVSMIKRG